MTAPDLTATHAGLTDAFVARRYFAKFRAITAHLARVAVAMRETGALSRLEVRVLGDYVAALDRSFHALSLKYLLTGRETGTFLGSLTMDRHESGFPVFQEILTLATDAAQAARHLANAPDAAALKDEMIRVIVGDRQIPTKLQFALSQRLYYEALGAGDLFWARNDPVALWVRNEADRRVYLLHWAVYDSQQNLPFVYLMEVEDSGRVALPKDQYRWPEAQAHLAAQSIAGLKLLTIAQGFDKDFADLHPKRLRRLLIGPMYSSAFTLQSGPIAQILAEARAAPGEDWALAWTSEELIAARATWERAGWFAKVERQIFDLDPLAGPTGQTGAETGTTRIDRAVILPQRPYQVLAEQNPPGFARIQKYVVSPRGRVFVTP